MGGRGIRNYIDSQVKPSISRQVLMGGKKPGDVRITYNKAAKAPVSVYTPRTANTNARTAAPKIAAAG
jgi:hypothetical protein